LLVVFFILYFAPGENSSGSSFLADSVIRIGDITLKGNVFFSEKKLKSLLPKKGTVFSQDLFEKNIERIIAFYTNHGFAFVKVTPFGFYLDSSYISYQLLIEPGQTQRINDVVIKGLVNTNPDFFRQKVQIKYDDIFSETRLYETIKKLEKIYYISVDSFKLLSAQEEGWIDIVFFLYEQTAGDLKGAISYSNNSGFSGLIDFSNSNFFGEGRKVDIKLEREGEDYQNEVFEYTEPYIFYLPLNLNFELNHYYIKDNYNLVSFSSGLEYLYYDVIFSGKIGMEFLSSEEIGESYPFIGVGFLYDSESFDISYRERFRKGNGWDLDASADIYFFFLLLKLNYFKIAFETETLTHFKSFRGYPGMIVREGGIVGIELRKEMGLLTVYPFVDANFFENRWQFSYGFGLGIKKFSLEYAVPEGTPFPEGRIYFKFE
jgi:outer membrane protein assembly factor BamA